MKKYDNYVLFDSYENYQEDMFEEIKKDLINTTADEVTDARVWEEIYEMQRDDYEEMIEAFERAETAHDNRYWIVSGNSGSWLGTYHGLQIYENAKEMFKEITKDCDYVKVYVEEGCLFIKASHHDGTHKFRIKIIMKNGMNSYFKWYDEVPCKWKHWSDYKMYNHLFVFKSETPKMKKYL